MVKLHFNEECVAFDLGYQRSCSAHSHAPAVRHTHAKFLKLLLVQDCVVRSWHVCRLCQVRAHVQPFDGLR